MPRYFIEVAYHGANFKGFQRQNNGQTVQSEVERAFETIFKQKLPLTGSSRTDAGVHALQNFFHVDFDGEITRGKIYNLNAVLPISIVILNIFMVPQTAHCRFSAVSREYVYYIAQAKSPFYSDRSWHYPYKIDLNFLNQAAQLLLSHKDFTSFSKRNTQVNNFICSVEHSLWVKNEANNLLEYHVKANRFLRGMVRGLVGTMLKVGRQQISVSEFNEIILLRDCSKASFSTPPQGLFLKSVNFPKDFNWKSVVD